MNLLKQSTIKYLAFLVGVILIIYAEIHSNSLISVIYLGIVPTGIAWLLRFRILKNNGLIFQSQVSYLIPIFGTILGYVFLKELITIKVLISLIAVCIGIYFVKKADNKKAI